MFHTVRVCTKPALCSNGKPSPPSLGNTLYLNGAGSVCPGFNDSLLSQSDFITVTIHSHGLCRYKRWACRPVTSRASQPSRSLSLLPGTRRLQNSPRHPGRTWNGEESNPCPPSESPSNSLYLCPLMWAIFHQERTKSLSIVWKIVFMTFEAFCYSLQNKLFYFYCKS